MTTTPMTDEQLVDALRALDTTLGWRAAARLEELLAITTPLDLEIEQKIADALNGTPERGGSYGGT